MAIMAAETGLRRRTRPSAQHSRTWQPLDTSVQHSGECGGVLLLLHGAETPLLGGVGAGGRRQCVGAAEVSIST